MAKGRKCKPANVVALEGFRGNRKRPPGKPREPKASKQHATTCPKWPNEVARREWRRIFAELERLGRLTRLDRGALAALCQEYSRYVEAQKEIDQSGAVLKTETGYAYPNPYVGIAKTSLRNYVTLCGEFGCTPAARVRQGGELPQDGEREAEAKWEGLIPR